LFLFFFFLLLLLFFFSFLLLSLRGQPAELSVAFPDFVAVHLVELGSAIVLAVVIVGVAIQVKRWHAASIPARQLSETAGLKPGKILGVVARSLASDTLAIKPLFHKSRFRWWNHLLIMWGFVGLALTTTLAYILNPAGAPEPLTWPVRILGNASGGLLVLGCAIFFARLLVYPSERNTFTLRADLVFFGTLFLATLTGFATELYGYGSDASTADAVYATHLVFVVVLLGSAPFTRFLHAIMTPYIAILERLRARLSGEGRSVKFKDRRIEDYVADNFYPADEDRGESSSR
jgi:hypothetical protein